MGLTIYYKLETNLTKVEDVRRLVEALRQYAVDLSFQEVEEVVEFKGNEVSHDNEDDPNRWLKIQAGQFLNESYSVVPLHILAFSTFPGEGSEQANFGFCRYPESIVVPDSRRRLPTNLKGWAWQSCCKTQYASDPECGGVPNFLRCHLCIVKLLDFAKKTNLMTVEVSDEGGYWQDRNLEKLGNEVGNWNEMMAALAGQFKDAAQAMGLVTEAAIMGFSNFEHLEAKGLKWLKDGGLFGNS